VAPDVWSLKVEEGGTNEALPSIFMKCPTVFVKVRIFGTSTAPKNSLAKVTDVQSNIPIKQMANLSLFFKYDTVTLDILIYPTRCGAILGP